MNKATLGLSTLAFILSVGSVGWVAWSGGADRRAIAAKVNLIASDPPIGTIMAFAGQWSRDKEGKPQMIQGWCIYEGQTRLRGEFRELFLVIGELYGKAPNDESFLMPDLKGVFLRGVDLEQKIDVDSKTRRFAFPVSLNKTELDTRATRNGIGSWQDDATSLPTSIPFATGMDGEHEHSEGNFDRLLQANEKRTIDLPTPLDDKGPEPNLATSAKMTKGKHSHTVNTGGDAETRPTNVAVYWIIKAKLN